MEEIKAGDYCKLDNGKIGKVIAVEKGSIMLDIRSNRWVGLCCITKHSKNIIDLIEVGDIVNGFPVMEPVYNGNVCYGVDEGYEQFKRAFGEIKTILTHEMYEQNCYKVGGEK